MFLQALIYGAFIESVGVKRLSTCCDFAVDVEAAINILHNEFGTTIFERFKRDAEPFDLRKEVADGIG